MDYDYNGENIERLTNEEYRARLNEIFSNINENYKLRWFYNFITTKIESSK